MTDETTNSETLPPAELFNASKLDWALRMAVPVLALLVALFSANPKVLGSFQDDALYADMARSLGEGSAFVSESLPGEPSLGKYPILYPALLSTLYLFGEPSLMALFILQSVIYAAFITFFILGVLPVFGLKWPERLVILAVLLSHDILIQTMSSLLSEALYSLLLCLQFVCLDRVLAEQDKNWKWSLGLGATSFLACLTRSVSLVLGPPLILYLLAYKHKKAALALVASLILSVAVQSGLRQQLKADNEARHPTLQKALAYYLDYSFHTAYYKEPLKEGKISLVAERIAETSASNSYRGVRALGSLFDPLRVSLKALGYKEGKGGLLSFLLGLSVFALACFGLYKEPRARPLFAVILPYGALFIAWTWVFSARFWLPILPFLLTGLILSARHLRRAPKLTLLILTLGFLIPHGCLLFQSQEDPDLSGRDPQSLSQGEREFLGFEKQVAWLSETSSRERGDVFIGGFNSFWVARRVDLPGLWLASLAPRDAFIRKGLSLAPLSKDPLAHSEAAWAHLKMLREALPGDGTVFIQLDFSSSVEERAWVQEWEKRGRVTLLTGSPISRLYKVSKQSH